MKNYLFIIVLFCSCTKVDCDITSIYGIYDSQQRCGNVFSYHVFELSKTNKLNEIKFSFVGAGSFAPFLGELSNNDCSSIIIPEQNIFDRVNMKINGGEFIIQNNEISGTIEYPVTGSCFFEFNKQ